VQKIWCLYVVVFLSLSEADTLFIRGVYFEQVVSLFMGILVSQVWCLQTTLELRRRAVISSTVEPLILALRFTGLFWRP